MTAKLQQIQDNLNTLLQKHGLKQELDAKLIQKSSIKLRNSGKSTLDVPLFTQRGHEAAMPFVQRLWEQRDAQQASASFQ